MRQNNNSYLDVYNMPTEQKRFLMNEIDDKREFALKYVKWFALLEIIIAFAALYAGTFVGSAFIVDYFTPFMVVFPLVIGVLGLIANGMKRLVVLLAMLAFCVFGIYCIFDVSRIICTPFAFFGAFRYYQLLIRCDMHDLLKNMDGYPTFLDLHD